MLKQYTLSKTTSICMLMYCMWVMGLVQTPFHTWMNMRICMKEDWTFSTKSKIFIWYFDVLEDWRPFSACRTDDNNFSPASMAHTFGFGFSTDPVKNLDSCQFDAYVHGLLHLWIKESILINKRNRVRKKIHVSLSRRVRAFEFFGAEG